MEIVIVFLLLMLIFVIIFRREIDFLIDLAVTLGVLAFIVWALWSLLGSNLISIIGSICTGLGVYWWTKDRKKKREQPQPKEE